MGAAAMTTGHDRGAYVLPPSATREFVGSHRAVPVFDRGRAGSLDVERHLGFQTQGAHTFGAFRETRRRPPREVVTAVFMGDPAPDRVVPEIPDDQDARVWRQPAEVHLTFASMRTAYEDPA